RDQGNNAGHGPDRHPDGLEGNAHRGRRLVVVSDRPQGSADARLLGQKGQYSYQGGGSYGRQQVKLIEQQTTYVHRGFWDPEVELLNIAAPDEFPEAFEEKSQADGRHQEGERRLVDEGA